MEEGVEVCECGDVGGGERGKLGYYVRDGVPVDGGVLRCLEDEVVGCDWGGWEGADGDFSQDAECAAAALRVLVLHSWLC